MSDDVIAELLRHCKSTFGIDLSPSSGPRELRAAGLAMLKSLVQLGRAAMHVWYQQLGDGDLGSQVTRNGVRYRRVGKRAKTIHGLFGWVTYVRFCYARLDGGGAGWAPLDQQLGVERGYAPDCQYFMACFCGRQPYQESLDHFHEVFRADGIERISMRKAYQMTCEVNRGLEQQRQQEITDYLEEDKRVAVQDEITETMVVCIDAGKVPTRANENVDDAGNKSYECQYRDSKIATVSAVPKRKDADEPAAEDEDDEVRLTNTSCVTGIEHADAFFPRIEVEMQRRSAQLAALTLVRLPSGRLLFPVEHHVGELWTPEASIQARCVISDDEGETWHEGAAVRLQLRGCMEPHVEALTDGSVLMVMRTQLGSVFSSRSRDEGLTWSAPRTTALRAPESCSELSRHPQSGELWLLWNDSEYDPGFGSHFGKRSPLSLAVSSDEGRTWQRRSVIESDPDRAFTNPGVCFLRDGSAIVNYWTCRYRPDRRMAVDRIDLRAALLDCTGSPLAPG